MNFPYADGTTEMELRIKTKQNTVNSFLVLFFFRIYMLSLNKTQSGGILTVGVLRCCLRQTTSTNIGTTGLVSDLVSFIGYLATNKLFVYKIYTVH